MTNRFITLLACFISLTAFAIGEKQAFIITQNFLIENNITRDNTLSSFSLKEVLKKEEIDMFYIMSLGNDEGFVIVSASEYLPPVFAYSFENKFEGNPAIRFYLSVYSDFILQEKELQNQHNEDFVEEWNHFLADDFMPNRLSGNGVPPLITTRWNQNKFYNTYCPWDYRAGVYFDYRVPNGCVALAGAQLMNYYRHPESGKYTYSYKPAYYPQQTIFPAQQKYNWDAMCDRATNYTNEIAKLAYHLGVTVQMGYAPGGSGANMTTLSEALHRNYAYSYGDAGNDTVKFKSEIDALRPILMSGCNKDGCHAFLIDGYIENPKIMFNFNWGWGGADDAYFFLDNHYFTKDAVAILNVRPVIINFEQCRQFKRQTASQGYVTNGSTIQPYESGPDCSWLIAAPGASQYTFSFSRLDTQEDIDVITIYNGSTVTSGVAETFSGTTTPAQKVFVDADSVLITFTSTDPNSVNNTHRGFLMNYTTNKPQQKCDEALTLKNPTGYITDGTLPDENYAPWTSCTWNIAPDYNVGFFGLFHEFNLALGDFVDFFDATKNPPALMTRFDKNNPPTIGEVFNLQTSKVQMKFITDNYDQGKGFMLQYFSMLGVNNNSLLDNLAVFPNPASEVINISFSSQLINQTVNGSIVDVTGKEVCLFNIDYQGDDFITQIPVAHLSNGIYFLQLSTSTGKVTTKIIKI